jgi:hypothetical protein
MKHLAVLGALLLPACEDADRFVPEPVSSAAADRDYVHAKRDDLEQCDYFPYTRGIKTVYVSHPPSNGVDFQITVMSGAYNGRQVRRGDFEYRGHNTFELAKELYLEDGRTIVPSPSRLRIRSTPGTRSSRDGF